MTVKVLIAEDDNANRRLLEVTIKRCGYEPVLCCDGEQALAALQSDDAAQIAILDWMMPGLDGIDVCRKVRAAPDRFTYIMLLTTKSQKEDVINGLQAGADDYVTKPFDREELQARLQVAVRMVDLQKTLAVRDQELAVARALATESERFEAATMAMSDGILVTRANWKLTTVNRAACLFLNLPAEGAEGVALDAALEPFTLTRPHSSAPIKFAELQADHERVVMFEIARRDTQPPLYLDARLTRLRDAGGASSGTVLTLRDVTAERHALHLRQSFFMMVSHKLRTPLTVLRGYLQLCGRMPPQQMMEQMPHVLATCGAEVNQLQQLVQKLLEFKRVTEQDLEADAKPAEVAPCVAFAIEEARKLHPERALEVQTQIASAAAQVNANSEHVIFVLERLLDNAVKFGDKQPIAVQLKVERKDANWLRFSVTDNGPGIPHEYHDKVFQGFVQVEDRITGQVPGLGVGLYMARQVVEAYEGRISIQSRLKEGCTISFMLPSSASGWAENEIAV